MANEAECAADRHAEFADTLLVIDDQKANAKIVVHTGSRCAFPMVISTVARRSCTRKGFSTQGAPVSRKMATVSSFTISPVINTMRLDNSGRLAFSHW